jgi:glycosyltransferase involved in cell wall biosynthesis
MFRNHRVVVVVPCFNVGRHLTGVLEDVPRFVDEVVVVDDGSDDDVAQAVAAARRSGVTILRHDKNRGLARAMQTGLRRALSIGADIVVKVDGDGQMDATAMGRLLEPVAAGAVDLAKGNRFVHRRHLAGMPRRRLVGNLLLSFLTKLASGYWSVFDPTNGYLAIRRELLEEVDLDRLGPGFFFEISLLCQANLAGAVVRDVAIPARYGGEPSALSLPRTILMFPPLLVRAFLRRLALQHFLRDFTPVALLLLTGGLISLVGLWYGAAAWLHHSALHQPTPAGTIAVAALPTLAGFHLLLQAFVLDIGSVPTQSPWGPRPPDARVGPRESENRAVALDEALGADEHTSVLTGAEAHEIDLRSREDPAQPIGERGRIARLDEEPRLAVDHDLGRTADAGRDDGRAAEHRLEQHESEPL